MNSLKKLGLFILLAVLLASCEKEETITLFELENEVITMETGEIKEIKITKFYPLEPKSYEMELVSKNPDIVTVENGKLKALQLGEARIDVRVKTVIVSCFVHVTSINDPKYDIYLAGGGINNNAMYVKNGVAYDLSPDKPQSDVSYATCIDVQGEDVFVGGNERIDDKSIAVLWKNGVKTIISNDDNYSRITDLVVSNNNVYVIGYETFQSYRDIAFLWINGDKKYLSESWTFSVPYALAIKGNDIYVAGVYRDYNDSWNKKAVYWKNDQIHILSTSENAEANDIFLSGNDIYICGYNEENGVRVATLWKNGVAQKLSDGNTNSTADAVSLVGDDVYVAGYEEIKKNHPIPVIWKNGVKQIISNGMLHGYKVNLKTFENDIFISADMFYEPDIYLRNNQPITLFQSPFRRITDYKFVPKTN